MRLLIKSKINETKCNVLNYSFQHFQLWFLFLKRNGILSLSQDKTEIQSVLLPVDITILIQHIKYSSRFLVKMNRLTKLLRFFILMAASKPTRAHISSYFNLLVFSIYPEFYKLLCVVSLLTINFVISSRSLLSK